MDRRKARKRRKVFRCLCRDRNRIARGENGPSFRYEFGKGGPAGKYNFYPRGRVIFDTWPPWMGRPTSFKKKWGKVILRHEVRDYEPRRNQ